jgi:hypothetical protein
MVDYGSGLLSALDFILPVTVPRRSGFGIAFGSERLALIPFPAPLATVLIAAADRHPLAWLYPQNLWGFIWVFRNRGTFGSASHRRTDPRLT